MNTQKLVILTNMETKGQLLHNCLVIVRSFPENFRRLPNVAEHFDHTGINFFTCEDIMFTE